MVEHQTETLEGKASERDRKLFRQAVADRVGMAATLALHDLDLELLHSGLPRSADGQLHLAAAIPPAGASPGTVFPLVDFR